MWQPAINSVYNACVSGQQSCNKFWLKVFCLFPGKFSAMAITEEPILSRLDRIDTMLRQLEEIRGCSRSPKSSCASTPSSGTLTSEGQVSSVDFSPKSLEKHCRPIGHVMTETEIKGTLIERIDNVEERVIKLEGELEAEKNREEETEQRVHKKGLKGLVRKMVKGTKKHKSTGE